MATGTSRMWMTKSRLMISSAGNSPPKTRKVSHVPASGIDRAME